MKNKAKFGLFGLVIGLIAAVGELMMGEASDSILNVLFVFVGMAIIGYGIGFFIGSAKDAGTKNPQ